MGKPSQLIVSGRGQTHYPGGTLGCKILRLLQVDNERSEMSPILETLLLDPFAWRPESAN